MARRKSPKQQKASGTEKANTTPARDVSIRHEPVELASLLKFGDVVSSGGEAKLVIQDGLVLVNGEQETRRRRKLVAGDVVRVGEHCLQVVLETPPPEAV